jgi:hypothetical protein
MPVPYRLLDQVLDTSFGDAQSSQDFAGYAILNFDQPYQQVFGTDVIVPQALSFFLSQSQRLTRAPGKPI